MQGDVMSVAYNDKLVIENLKTREKMVIEEIFT